MKLLREVHDHRLLRLYRTAEKLEKDKTFYPSVFPKRHQVEDRPDDINHGGYFCFDSGTPLAATTWSAATWSAACADSATKWVDSGKGKAAYALCRPPGHHASRDLFGGYCYFNNAAISATRLKQKGRVAILDIDFHHGNGTQAIFYRDPEVLFFSIHGDPSLYYPFFWGHASERGAGEGEGTNINIPLPGGCDGQEYLRVLEGQAIQAIKKFDPASLILSAGFDTYKGDPIGKFALDTPDFHLIGATLGRLKLPTVIVQEGGYCTDRLGVNVVAFLEGFHDQS